MCNQCLERYRTSSLIGYGAKKIEDSYDTQYNNNEWVIVDNNYQYAIINEGEGKKELVKVLPDLKNVKLSI